MLPFSHPVSNCSAFRQSRSAVQLSPKLSLDRALQCVEADSRCGAGSGRQGTA